MTATDPAPPPRRFHLGEFHFSVLGPDCVEEDFLVVTSSEAHLAGLFGSDWPRGLTLEKNLSDLQRHAREFDEDLAYAWVVRNADGGYLGCVYLCPEGKGKDDRTVYLWLQFSESSSARVAELVRLLKAWMPGIGYDPARYSFIAP